MKHYKHQQASSAKEAASSAASGTAALIAGGTDLLGTLKDEILPTLLLEFEPCGINKKAGDGYAG